MDLSVEDSPADGREARRIGAIRMVVGLVQGLLVYLLTESHEQKLWPSTDPVLYAALGAAALFAPLVLIAGLASLRRPVLVGWTLASAAIAAGLAGYEAWRNIGDPMAYAYWPWTLTQGAPLTAAVLFIGNHLLEASETDRKFIAAYPSYFSPAWKHGLQGVLSVIFTAIFWGLLRLGAELFRLIHITLLADIIDKAWFYWPATGVAFAAAVHLTDVRPAVVQGVRVVALTLLAWLTPLLAVLAGAFLLALPFTGLQPLWQTKAAATILLSAASMLILLTNATYQDGAQPPTAVLRWAGRAAGVILVPLVVLAGIGLWLRIQQYGLTPQRILASAWAVIVAAYAAGYAFAAVRPGGWMKPLERTNVAAAWLILVVAALLFTPLADPARLSVGDQVARLEAGRIKPEAFDYNFLHFRAARYGREALARLAARKDAIGARAVDTEKQQYPWATPVAAPQTLASRFNVYPAGGVLPEGFIDQDWNTTFLPCVQAADKRCDAYLVDLDGDGAPEVLVELSDANLMVFGRGSDGKWSQTGNLNGCPVDLKALHSGQARAVPAEPHSDLEVNGQRLRFTPMWKGEICPKTGRPLATVVYVSGASER